LREAGQRGSFDFAFIDADKENYDAYYEASLELVRPGASSPSTHVLWSGAVADSKAARMPTPRRCVPSNLKLHDDERVDISMLPVGDGLTLGA